VDLPYEGGRTRKAHVLLAATELYVAASAHTPRERQQFEELFRQLLRDTPVPHRRIIARLLAPYPYAPNGCLALLAFDPDAEVSAAALATPQPIPEASLVNRVTRGPETVRAVIADRRPLPARVVTALFAQAAPDTLRALLARDDIAPDDDALAALITRAEVLEAVAPDLARRKALSAPLLFRLFLALDAAGRMEAIAAAEARTLSELARKGDPRILAAHFKPDVLKSLVEAALSGGRAAFAAHLAYTLDLPADVAAGILDDSGGEAIVACLRALGTSDADTGRILVRLFGETLPLERMRDLLRLHAAITPRAAMLLVNGLRADLADLAPRAETAAPSRTATHLPLRDGLAHAERRRGKAETAPAPARRPLPTGRRTAG